MEAGTTCSIISDKLPFGHNESTVANELAIFKNKTNMEIISQIGKGGFSLIYLTSYSNNKMILKLTLLPILQGIQDRDKREREQFRWDSIIKWFNNEVLALMNIKHKNIIKCFGYYDFLPNSRALMLELAANKDLNYFTQLFYEGKAFQAQPIDKPYFKFISENVLRFFFKQIYDVLSALKDNNLLHGDIKLENVLLVRNFTIKLADFATSNFLPTRGVFQPSKIGTFIYMPPECLDKSIKDTSVVNAFKIDYYAMGVMLYKMLFNDYIYKPNKTEENDIELYRDVLVEFNENPVEFIKKKYDREISSELIELLKGLLDPYADMRFNINQIKENKWLFQNRKAIANVSEGFENDSLKMLSELQKMDYINFYNQERPAKRVKEKRFKGRNFITIKINKR
jgi:serine/threonine protein kinase